MIDLAAMLGRIRRLRLSERESGRIRAGVSAARERKPVRETGDACHTGAMEDPETLLPRAKDLRLTAAEEAALRRTIDAYVLSRPVAAIPPTAHRPGFLRRAFFRPL